MLCLHINRATMSYVFTIHFRTIFVLAFWEHHWIDTYWVGETRNFIALGLELCVPQTSFEILSFSPHLQNHGADEDRISRMENMNNPCIANRTSRLAATLLETNMPVLLMEEILHQLECIKPCIFFFFNNGVNYHPQLVNTGFLNHQQ